MEWLKVTISLENVTSSHHFRANWVCVWVNLFFFLNIHKPQLFLLKVHFIKHVLYHFLIHFPFLVMDCHIFYTCILMESIACRISVSSFVLEFPFEQIIDLCWSLSWCLITSITFSKAYWAKVKEVQNRTWDSRSQSQVTLSWNSLFSELLL